MKSTLYSDLAVDVFVHSFGLIELWMQDGLQSRGL